MWTTTAVDGCRRGVLGYVGCLSPRRGTKTPKCWGGLTCGTTSERPLLGLLEEGLLRGACRTKVFGCVGFSFQLRPAVQSGVAQADRVLGVAPWGPSWRRGPLHANSHAGWLGTTLRGVVGAPLCADTTAYPAGQTSILVRFILVLVHIDPVPPEK